MSNSIDQLRRQQFLTREFYESQFNQLDSIAPELLALYQAHPDKIEQRRSWSYHLADDSYKLLSLKFTAGEHPEKLRAELVGVIEAYERFQKALEEYEQIPNVAPLGMGNIGDYERCMQLIGLCYLLHRRDLLPRIAALQDPGYAGEDALYEDLLDYALPERYDTDAMLHLEAYDPLIDAMYADSDDGCAQAIQRYVDDWYPHFKYIPWHDGHLGINGTEGYYFGYWAFEAGAVALLCDIDDSQIDHMVYPKDLVAWARQHAHLSATDGASGASGAALRCEAGQPCPQEGWWVSPARANSRRRFELNDTMPELGGDYGATIWQWDVDQSS